MGEPYAVFRDGSHQFRVRPGDVLDVERRDAEEGSRIAFGEVLLLGGGAGTRIGTPTVSGATVAAEVVGPFRGPKVITHNYRRRKDSHVRRGHRQDYTRVRITGIETGG
ncbi:MAG: 50S ribosomal protein L21 [Planctomycetes bacterium]|nr:50S ribosomal protein L21 [Planctomycetota bacterium]